MILAKAGRPECKTCIAGLRQYSIAFGHLWEVAEEVEQLYRANTPMSRTPSYTLPMPGMAAGMSVNQLLSSPATEGQRQEPMNWGAKGVDGREDGEWNVPGAGAHLVSFLKDIELIYKAANGFTSLPMISKDGLPHAPRQEASAALFDWLHRPPP